MKRNIKTFIKQNNDLIIAFFLALFLRIIIAILFNLYIHGIIIVSDPLIDEIIWYHFEPYTDYYTFYIHYGEQFTNGSWIPYQNWMIIDLGAVPYIHPPFFLYAMGIPALISKELVFLPFLIADMLTPVVIYKMLKDLFNPVVAGWGFLAAIFCPIPLLYNGSIFLNTSVVTLFFVLSIYYASIKKYNYSMIMLGISILFKQIALLFCVPLVAYVILQKSSENQSFKAVFTNFFRYIGILFLTLLLGSLPWIILFPYDYLISMTYGVNPLLYITYIFSGQPIVFKPELVLPALNSPMNWYKFLIPLGSPDWFILIVSALNSMVIGIIFVELISIFLLLYWYHKKNLEWIKFFDLLVYSIILLHLFFPRGIFKYYLTFITPLLVLWICFHYSEELEKSSRNQTISFSIFMVISLSIVLINRLFYLLIVWAVLFLMIVLSKLKSKRKINFIITPKIELH
jgi:hypothetical protein